MPAWVWPAVELWWATRSPPGFGTPGGLRWLPCSGGYGDQPAALLDAFAVMETKYREVTGG